jgi:putative ABC transport system ATP-binding protein
MTRPTLLSGEGLGRLVRGEWIWRGLDLAVSAGDRAALVGPSGAGKSLLLRALCGLDHPDEGAVRFRGEAVSSVDTPSFRANVLYVQQQPVLVPGTVADNLALPLQFAVHSDRDGIDGRSADLFVRLGKPAEFLDQRASLLSGGEAQLVGLVRAILLNPDVLLLDEPTAHLDHGTTQRVEELVLEWLDGGARALIWTSHDRQQVDRVRKGPLFQLGGEA